MDNWKNKLSKLTGNTKIKQGIFTAFAVAALSFGTGTNALANEESLTTVYYVYFGDQYIGTVTDKHVVQKLINEKLTAAKELNSNLDLTIGDDLTYIPEQVFRTKANANNEEVLKKLETELTVGAEATALVIDGQQIAYVKDKSTAEAVIKQLKLQYVTEEQLKELEGRAAADPNSLPPLKENETRILDVQLTKEVSFSEAKTTPNNILSVDEAVALLQKGTLEEKKYQVQEGDVLGSIANDHNLKLAELIAINPGLNEDTVLQIGDEVNITFLQPYVHVNVKKEVFKQENIPFQNETVEDASMPKGESQVKQEGKDGLRNVTYAISEQNGQVVEQQVLKEEVLQEAVNHVVVKGTKVIPSRGEGSFVWPAVGGYVSSKMGYRWEKMHKGIDIARPSDRTIKAADNGIVVSAGWDGGYGNKIVIDHQNGFRTVYAHLDSMTVSAGQTVERGSKIGVMGATGDSTGVHLHFELYKNGNLEDPLNYIR
ncbi:peptidase M23 [Bacillus sp. V3-13]|uniref:peptidoglycan DD-metalloendopeptidase family protein n=1 Tax=Bacillus sp. V3-13 TaxID=2053728 RepID=UPI000C764F50|nr:M23 family metallopeptidase [Bacillus sp. V3-13]PLR78287.1 peptidase M23 [Bacillus sp. V3-13]